MSEGRKRSENHVTVNIQDQGLWNAHSWGQDYEKNPAWITMTHWYFTQAVLSVWCAVWAREGTKWMSKQCHLEKSGSRIVRLTDVRIKLCASQSTSSKHCSVKQKQSPNKWICFVRLQKKTSLIHTSMAICLGVFVCQDHPFKACLGATQMDIIP